MPDDPFAGHLCGYCSVMGADCEPCKSKPDARPLPSWAIAGCAPRDCTRCSGRGASTCRESVDRRFPSRERLEWDGSGPARERRWERWCP